mgnify:CR=1 FL=1
MRLLPARQPHIRLTPQFDALSVQFDGCGCGENRRREMRLQATADGLFNAVVRPLDLDRAWESGCRAGPEPGVRIEAAPLGRSLCAEGSPASEI